MKDLEARRRIAQLEDVVRRLKDLLRIDVVPPLQINRGYGIGTSISLAQNEVYDAVIEITTGSLQNGKYAATIEWRDTFNLAWIDDDRIWALDLAGSAQLVAGDKFPAIVGRNEFDKPVREVGGPYYCSTVPNNLGHPLTDVNYWLAVVGSITPSAWNSGTAYVAGNLVTSGGNVYLCKAPNTNQAPPNSTYWILVVLTSRGGYNPQFSYLFAGDYVQEIRPLFSFRSEAMRIGSPVIGGGANGVLYIDASQNLAVDETKFYYDDSSFTFGVVGNSYFDIKNSKTFIVEETTTNNLYFKIDNSTHQINIWESTLIINEGLVKIDISIGDQIFTIWDQTNFYIDVDDATQLITFWNSLVTISSTYFKISNGGSDFFYVDASDQSIKIGWPSKATSDTSKYSYWHYVAGKPTGAVPSKSGYWAWLWDSTNYRSWFYAQSVSKWLLECCWIIVKKSSNYTAEFGDFIWGDTSGGGVDIDLPSPLLNQEIKIRTDGLTNPLRVTGTGIGTNVPLTKPNTTYDFYSDGSNWLTDDVDAAIPEGTATGDMLVWNESDNEWQILDAPTVDGYVLTSDSGETLKMKWAPSCCYEPYTETFDVDGTFTSTFDGYIEIEAYGAGGAGISTNTNGGGGGGAYAKKNSYAVTNGGTYTVVVATNSTEDSYFVSTAVIKAVSGATTATSSGGAGGAAASCVGDVTYSGGDGAAYSAPDGGGGGGCATSSANGGNASGATGGTGSFAGGTGGGDGFGGGGGGGSQAGGAGAGGSGLGGVGRVIVTRIS